jgi:hypothetical protein
MIKSKEWLNLHKKILKIFEEVLKALQELNQNLNI